ncbi:hypothetical protein JO41_01910 [Treponema sp. OMZ 838]|uniref:BrnA antitoxin family protein n=1 Tax=Treponema sp. OMZ 838 TaxID=1539298 RepID=UPI0005300EB0|nr:BrnA antitoxin family protein [Treponema sp. OMZ 838]AIW88704.1 hypothetical protein JO41_01910 [Treponema sp. OMZ 838]
MSTIVTMTLEEVMNAPLTQEEILNIRQAVAKVPSKQTEYDPECPKQTKEELAQFRPLKEVKPELYAKLHPEWCKPRKTEIHIRVDTDVLEWYKAQGKGYQTKMNAVLRAHAFG